MKLVSIIVPVYNVENFLDVCIKSIIRQTNKNIEIILVDDGSTDNSGVICDKWADIDERIKVIHKKNGGLSDARNEGLRVAKGEYIVFVDSDDFINENLVRYCLEIIKKEDADIVTFEYQMVEENCNTWVEEEENGSVESITGQGLLCEILKNKEGYVVAWNKFYKRNIWNELRFPFEKIHEDEFVIADVMLAAKKVVVSNQKLYYYRQRKGSIMSSRTIQAYYDGLEAHILRCERLRPYRELYGLELSQYCRYLFNVYWVENDKKKRRLLKQKYRNPLAFFAMMKRAHWKSRILYICFYISPLLYTMVLKIIKKKQIIESDNKG